MKMRGKPLGCVNQHMGEKSPIFPYRKDMEDEVAELVSAGKDVKDAWIERITDKIDELKLERSRIEQVAADEYAKARPDKTAKKQADTPPAPAAQPQGEPNGQGLQGQGQGRREEVAASPQAPADVMPAGLFVTFGGKSYPVESINDAQEKWIEFRDRSGGVVSDVGNGVRVTDGAGRFVARISYNGRAWDAEDGASVSGKMISEAPQSRTAMPDGVTQEAAETYIPPKETLEQARERSSKAAEDARRTVDAESATHADPGKPAEPVTPAVVKEAITKAAKREDVSPAEMKAEALRLIDEAIAQAQGDGEIEGITVGTVRTVRGKGEITGWREFPDGTEIMLEAREGALGNESAWTLRLANKAGKEAARGLLSGGTPKAVERQMKAALLQMRPDGVRDETGGDKITIQVPGDGAFTVVNTVERLREFRKLVERSPGFATKQAKPRIEKAITSGDLSPNSLAREMLAEGEWLNALEVTDAAGTPLMFGNGTDGEPIPYTHAEPIEIAGFKFFSGHKYSGKDKGPGWAVIHMVSGMAAGWGGTRADAVAQATKALKDEKALAKVRQMDAGKDAKGKPFPTQAELRERFLEKATATQERTFAEQDRIAAVHAEMNRKDRERQAFYAEIMGEDQKLSAFRNAASSNEGLIRGFLNAAEKKGKAGEAVKLLDDVFPESNTWARKVVADWEKSSTKNALEVGYNTVKTGAPPYTLTWDEIEPSIDAQVYVTRSARGEKNYGQWKEAHFDAVKEAVDRGWRVPDKVLYDYPSLLRSDLNDDQKDLAADAMVTTYQQTKDYGKAVQAYRDWTNKLDLKGFTEAQRNKSGFVLEDGDITVLVNKTKTWDGKDRFQARLKNSTTESSPNLTEQQAIDWADNLRRDMRKAASDEAKTPAMYAGGDNVEAVSPKAGIVAWTTDSDSGKLEKVEILRSNAGFDQHTTWVWRWLTGPNAGTENSAYGRSFWMPTALRKGAKTAAPAAQPVAEPQAQAPEAQSAAPTMTPAEEARRNEFLDRQRAYWDGTATPAIRNYLRAFDAFGVERMERNRIKPAGMSAREWLESFVSRQSTWDGSRKTGLTGIQALSGKDLWPTEDGSGERLRKAMLEAVKALKNAPSTNGELLAEAFMEPKPAATREAAQSAAPAAAPSLPTFKGPATAQRAIDAFNADDAPLALAVMAKLPLAELQDVGAAIGFRPQINENAKRYRERVSEVADRLTKTAREQSARERALYDKLIDRAMDYDRAADHAERAKANGAAEDSTAFDSFYRPMGGGETEMVRIPELLKRLAADVRSLRSDPDYAKVEPAVREKRPRVFEAADALPAPSTQGRPAKAGQVGNFGESLPPARRAMAAKLDESLTDDDIAKRPLSEIWPLAENEAIEDTFAAAVAHAARAEVPSKPRQPYKLERWVEKVKTVRELAGMIVSGRVTREGMADLVRNKHRSLTDWWSKVLLLEQIPREQWKRVETVEERPDSMTYTDGKQVPAPMVRVRIDDRSHWLTGDAGVDGAARGTVDGNRAGIMALLAAAEPEQRMEFEIRKRSKDGSIFVNKKGDPEKRPLMEFAKVEEARAAIKEYSGLAAAWDAIKARDNITERDLRSAENRPRAGKDHRQGRDVTPEEFQERFGFRGGEFGAWVQQGKGDKERQALLNSAYDALMDLADIADVPPRAISLNGTLGIAFGSRGSGWASAHFEPSNLVINLTKTRGAGALAHEWFHALDNYFSRTRRGGEEAKFTGDRTAYDRDNFITHQPEALMVRKDRSRYFPPMTRGKLEAMHEARKHQTDNYSPEKWERDPKSPEGVRPEVEARFAALVEALNDSPMTQRARLLDGNKSGNGYWSRTLERAARAFESYVIAKMHEAGYHNDFLVNVRKAEDTGKDPARYPYLLAGEVKPIAEAFDALFGEIKTRAEPDGNVAMFSRGGRRGGVAEQDLRALADSLQLKNPVRVSATREDWPAGLREEVDAAVHNENIDAALWDGKIWLAADRIPDLATAQHRILHEANHSGLHALMGPAIKRNLMFIYQHNASVRRRVGRMLSKLPDLPLVEATEEVLVEIGATGEAKTLKGWSRLVAAVRSWLRSAGFLPEFASGFTDNDVLYLMQRAGKAARVGGGLAFSRAGVVDSLTAGSATRAVLERVSDMARTSKSFNWFHRTVGTQFHKAKVHAGFGKVYDAVQEYLHDTSAFANDPAGLAGDLLPQLKSWRDAFRRLTLKTADREAVARAVFDGTLLYTRDDSGTVVPAGENDTPGVAFKPEELRSMFGLTERQINMYGQFRAATDRSLDILVASDVARLLGDGLPKSMRKMVSDGDIGRFKGIVTMFAQEMVSKAEADLAAVRKRHRSEMSALNRKQKAALEGKGGRAGARLATLEVIEAERRALKLKQGGEKHRAERELAKWTDLKKGISDRYARVNELKTRGYAPLMRFGRYTVDVLSEDGERQFFSMYETEREANAAARRFRENPDLVVKQGVMNDDAFKQFKGITPETAELFAELAGVDKSDLVQEYLRRAKGNRSALKRLIHRKGIPGFSEDVQRVLASFVTSNARAASIGLHGGAMKNAANDRDAIPLEQGDVAKEAQNLVDYVQNPQEEAQVLRSLLFAQYLGGSVASALVNATQPIMMTLPYLSQFGGPAKAAAKLSEAAALALKKIDGRTALGKALALAEREGIVSPQEIHQLQAEASRNLGSNQYARKFTFVWGSFFALAEQFNRRVSFIAAFNLAVERNEEDPFAFASETVDQTQGVYNKGNRPNWARGAIGATLFTFKQFSISYVEFIMRLPKREKVIALGLLILAAGLQGFPGADDLDDLIDTVGQHMGYATNSKAWKHDAVAAFLGEDAAEFVLRGASAIPGFPLDVSARLSLGNLIPGTGFLRKDGGDKSRDVTEAIGPFGSLAVNAVKAIPLALKGEITKANEIAGPTATKNLVKALEMYQTGQYKDQSGRRVTDVTMGDAIVKGVGFQPAHVARDSRKAQVVNQRIGIARQVEGEIASQWARGIADGNPDDVAEAKERLADWNRKNPEARIGINSAQIRKRVRQMMLTRSERMIKSAPREMRASMAEALQ